MRIALVTARDTVGGDSGSLGKSICYIYDRDAANVSVFKMPISRYFCFKIPETPDRFNKHNWNDKVFAGDGDILTAGCSEFDSSSLLLEGDRRRRSHRGVGPLKGISLDAA